MTDLYTAAELRQVKAYHRPYDVWTCAEPVVYFVFLAVMMRRGVDPLHAWSGRTAASLGRAGARLFRLPVLRVVPQALTRMWGDGGWGQALLFGVGLQLVTQAVYFPSVFYFGYLHEKAFGMWQASVQRFLWESLKSHVLSAMALAILTFGLYGLARRMTRWWLVVGVSASVLMAGSALLDPYRSRLHVGQEPLAQGPLRSKLEALLVRADVPFRDLVVEKTSALSAHVDAYFAGQGPTRTIVLDDTLLSQMSEDEVVAVVAHEAGHVHQRRWPAQVASAVCLIAFLWVADALMRRVARAHWHGIEHRADVRTFPWILGLFSLISVLSGPLVGYFSREREREADRYAIDITQAPEAFGRMLSKAGRLNRLDPSPPAFIVFLGANHPPIRERIRDAEAQAAMRRETAKLSAGPL